MTRIDFSRLSRRRHQDIISNKSQSAVNIRIQDKRVLMMIQDIRDVITETPSVQDVIESCIIATYNTLKKEQKL
jgi:hypothetical protein